MKTIRKFFLYVLLLAVTGGCAVLWLLYGSKTSNPHNYATVGDIPVPWGYERIAGNDAAYSSYLRSLPLKGKGSKVQLFTGGESRFQSLNYAVVSLPLLSNEEQCADVCMRLRAEYLFNTSQYSKIHFKNVNGKTMSYDGGSSRKAFERYMRKVYGVASTYSLSRETRLQGISMLCAILRIPSALRGLCLMKMPITFCLPCSTIRLTN